jgi:hypothetical protein
MPGPLNINVPLVMSNTAKQNELAAYFNPPGPGQTLTVQPYSNNIAVTSSTPLSAFTFSTFTGAKKNVVAPGAPYFDAASQTNRVSGGSVTVQGTNGVQQTMEFAVVGPCTLNGTVVVTVTAAGETGSPRAVTATVATTMSNSQMAQTIAGALATDADVGAFFNVSTANNEVVLQAKTAAANDATMDASLALGTATGVATVAHATQLVAGVAPGTFTTDNVAGVVVTDTNGALVGAFPAGASYSINAVGVGLTFDIDIGPPA